MFKRHVMLCATAVTVWTGAASAAVPQSPAIVVDTFLAQPIEVRGNDQGLNPGSIVITFTNQRTVAAKRAVFWICSREKLIRTVSTTGTFSPGIRITKSWTDSSQKRAQRALPVSARFVDGSHWSVARPTCKTH